MPKPPETKRPRDFNQRAFQIVREATGEELKYNPREPDPEKDPRAVKRGRLGGLKGGKARAESLSARQRREIAKKAAAARWRDRP